MTNKMNKDIKPAGNGQQNNELLIRDNNKI